MNKLLYTFFLALLCIFQFAYSSENAEVVKEVEEVVTEYITEIQTEQPVQIRTDYLRQLNAEDLKTFIENNEIAVVAFLDNDKEKEYSYFYGLASSLQEHKSLNFIYTNDPNSNAWATEILQLQINNPGIVIFKQGNGYPIPFDKIQSSGMFNVRKLCLKALNPYVDELEGSFTDLSYDYLLYFYADEDDKIEKIDLMQELAVKYFTEFRVKYINLAVNPLNMNYDYLSKKFIIVSKAIQSYYNQDAVLKPEDEINFENIDYFVACYKSSLIDPQFLWRTEEMNWEFTDYVTEIRPNMYESVVLAPNTDVLVLYYKSDCPYSQQVMKSFQDLAKRYIDQRDKLTIGQFEAENQNIPEFSPWRNLIEYPTVVLYPAVKDNKAKKRAYYVMKQNLGRSAVNIASWLLKRATNNYEEVRYTPTDYENATKIDGGIIVQDPTEEAKEIESIKLLTDPNLIYTIYGEGKDQKYYSIEKEENHFYIGNTDYGELPLTGSYYELTATTYMVHYAEPTNSAKEIARQNALKRQQENN